MDVLNLDDLASKARKRELVFKGVTHVVKDMSVEDFIEAQKEAKAIEAAAGDTALQLDAAVRMVKRTIPTIEEADVRALPLDMLGLLVRFINGELEQEAQKAEPEGKSGTTGE